MIASVDYIQPSGIPIPPEALRIPRSRSLAELLQSRILAFTNFLDCLASSEGSYHETIIFEVEVQRPQKLANDIRLIERLAATFYEADDRHPRVLSLRPDFPLVPHLNQEEQEFPRSLCLTDQPWQDLKLTWTPPAFIELIRKWLSLTAQGTLHAEDQLLEPLLLGTGYHIVLPFDLFDKINTPPERLDLLLVGGEDPRVFIARKRVKSIGGLNGLPHFAMILQCEPQQHGIIRQIPQNLKELNELTATAGLDLISIMRDRFKDWMKPELLAARLILIIVFPKTRQKDGPIQDLEIKAFLITNTIQEVGVNIGRWAIHDGRCSHLILPDATKDGRNLPVITLNPHRSFNWDLAAKLNGMPKREDIKIVAIGAGALGSQVIMNFARAGFGIWTIIDEDNLLPHNLARHALDGRAVGFPKAECVALTVNYLADDEEIASWIKADIFSPGEKESSISEAMNNAQIILDMSAGVAIGRHLAHLQYNGRRVSMFLNPIGTDLVLLVEDSERQKRLDYLEMQYYRSLWRDNRLHNHLMTGDRPIRYGQSCRDLSSRISQDLVSLHAGIGARGLRNALNDCGATIRVWKADPTSMNVEAITIPIYPTIGQKNLDWTLIIDHWVLEQMSKLRKSRLPNETGGILIGTHDMHRKIVYVVDVLPSPPDSVEWPALYIRGCEDLVNQVKKIQELTGQNLNYIGEWHSHPDGCPTFPSDDDAEVFTWLTEEMDIEGKPPLMFIVGEGGFARAFLFRLAERYLDALRPF